MDKTKKDLNKQEKVSDKVENKKPNIEKLKKNKKHIKPWIFLVLFDILMLIASVLIISSLSKKAIELNQRLSDEQKIKESKGVDITGLENQSMKTSVDKLESYFPEEPGLIDFIELVEDMKDKGLVKNFSLVGQDAVKDKTGAYGVPFIAEFEGSWESIDTSLQALQKLPYLIRAINVEVRVIDANIINFKYGGFLYVSDKLAKTR